MNRLRTIVLTAVAGLALVACGSGSSGSAQPSQEQSQAAQPPSDGNGAGPSFTAGAVSELEDLIPDVAGGLTFSKDSLRGSDYLVSSDADPVMVAFIQDLGVSPGDVSIARAVGFATDQSPGVYVFVFRAAGGDSNRLLAAFKTATGTETESPLEWSSATVGGKAVEVAESYGQTTYLYVKGDTLFFIASTQSVAEEILNGLP